MFKLFVFSIFAVAVVLGALFTYIEIPVIKRHQFGQFIREEGPQSHLVKQGTPTMGGIAIYLAVTIATLIGTKGSQDSLVIIVIGFIYGLIGFADDFIKVAAKHNLGLRAWQKLVLQIMVGVAFGFYIMKSTDAGSSVWIPFIGIDIDFGSILFPIFVAFVMVAMSNSVNLSDGMDGLCAGVSGIFSVFFAYVVIACGYLDSGIYLLATAGSCVGFLFFNKYPAKIFMGDTGSMALGGGMTAAIFMTKIELLIPIAGFIFVMEALSVIIQVISFKTTGKRVFRMSPLHHHFEEGGMKETKVVMMFWTATIVFCLLAFLILLYT